MPRALVLLALLVSLAASLAVSQTRVGESGLPLPRFVSLKAEKANLRVGPGENYPIEWVYSRSGLPLIVTDEHENWRRVRDPDGAEGWLHKALLSGRRTAMVTGTEAAAALSRATADGEVVFRVEPGVICRLESCEPGWCRVEVQGLSGWLPRERLFAALPEETLE